MSYIKKLLTNNHELNSKLAQKRREKVHSFRKKMNLRRTLGDKMADFMTNKFGTVLFLSLNAAWFALWILLNTEIIPGLPAFDPYPFGLLTMIVSLEAIFLAIIVLISQNRAAKTAELREEIDLQINVRAEAEITKILIILDRIHDHLGLPSEDDAELIEMKHKTNLDQIEKELAQEMGEK